uniref:Partner and localizer of BRCA2-like n=2 Tax=Salmo trutta TaxID=8032 RepID=A0A673WZH1_SALTR
MGEEKEGEKKELEREENERETPDKEAMKQRDGEEREEQRTYGQKEIEKEGVNLRRDGESESEEGGDSGAVGASGLCNTGGVLDSCTLVEGLPFPVEYYIRTTRRMASSQSHRDLQAVILNQLNRGRHRRSRGRMSNPHSLSTSHSDSLSTSHSDSLAQPSNHRQCSSQLTSNSPTNRTPVEEPSANQMLTSESGTNQNERLPSRACSVRPIRGQRGRGRRPRLGRSLSLDSDPPAPGPDNTQTPAAISPASQPLPGSGCPERWPLSGGVEEQLYPIFRKSCVSPLIHTPKQSKESVWCLLLPSSLSPGGPAVHPGSLGRVISTFDLQDFHLPDDQFGQLKLQKLRASSAVAVAVPEPFSPYNMRRRRSRGSVHGLHGDTGGLMSKAPTPEPLPLSLTPPVTDCVTPVEQSIDRSIGQHLIDHPIGQQSTDALNHSTDLHSEYHSVCQFTDHLVDQPTGHQSTDHLVDQPTDHQSTDQPTDHQSTDQPTDHQSTDQPIGHQSTDQPIGHQSTDHPVDQLIGHQLTVLVGQSIDFPSVDQQTGRLTTECPSLQTETETECPPECPSFHTKTKCLSTCPTKFSVECLTKCPSVCTTECPSLRTETDAECAVSPSPSLLLLSPSLTSHTPRGQTLSLPLSSSPPLPSLGMTPNPLTPNPNIPLSLPDNSPLPSLEAVTHIPSCPPCPPSLTLPLSCSPCPPTLTLPFPSSPSTQALSPPSLSPCPSPAIPLSSSPPSLAPCHPSMVDSLPKLLLPPTPLLLPQSLPPNPNTPPPLPPTQLLRQPAPSLHSTRQATEERGEGEEERAWRKKEEKRDGMTEEGVLMLSHTLKAPAGGSLVDVCCVSWLSVGVCVAVAGEWEVCVWGQTNPPHWRRLHTWTFIESVMSVFPVPDAPGLLCVTLGQLEIREARVLCCSSLSQAVLCEGEVQMVVGMSNRRLVSSSYSVATTPLQVYTLTQDGSLQGCLSLVCPTEHVRAVAAVEGQTDALIGSTHGGHVVLWNVTTGQLLQRITLGDGFTDTTCLRGYSLCGVLFVLLQHPSLCAVEEEEGGALFSLVATNPLTGTVALATRLCLPKACTGRLVEVDVHGSSVVGVFRSGSVCVWQLGRRQAQEGVWFPELGCQLARWGAQGTVLTAHLNGDVCLHRYRPL